MLLITAVNCISFIRLKSLASPLYSGTHCDNFLHSKQTIAPWEALQVTKDAHAPCEEKHHKLALIFNGKSKFTKCFLY